MRFVLYNICYATGPKVHHFARSSSRNLERISGFLRELEPDLVGLIEVDHGSYRTGGLNQSEQLAAAATTTATRSNTACAPSGAGYRC